MRAEIADAEKNILKLYVENKRYSAAFQYIQELAAPEGFNAEMQQRRLRELRNMFDKDTLCTIISAEKTATSLVLDDQEWHIERIKKSKEFLQQGEASHQVHQAQDIYQTEVNRWSGQNKESLKRLKRVGNFAEKLAHSAYIDEDYPGTLAFLTAARDNYRHQSRREKDFAGKEVSFKEETLVQLDKIIELLDAQINKEESVFPISRETYLASAEKIDYSTPERMYELRCAATAPSRDEIERDKRKGREELKRKMEEYFLERAAL